MQTLKSRSLSSACAARILLACLALLAFAPCLVNDFVLDDIPLVQNNPTLSQAGNLGVLVTQPYYRTSGSGLYRPLTMVSFGLEYKLWGPRPMGYHATNLALHALTTLLLFQWIWKLANNLSLAFITSLLFALHPVHTEAVIPVSARSELLSACFGLGVVLALDTDRWHRLFLGSVLLLLSILSKESGVMWAVFCILGLWTTTGRWPRFRLWPFLMAPIPVAIALRFLVMGRLAPTGASAHFLHTPLPTMLLSMGNVLWQYLRLLFFPVHLGVDFVYEENLLGHPGLNLFRGLAGYILTVSLVPLAWIFWHKKQRLACFGCLVYLTSLFPYCHIVPMGALMAERFLYVPSMGAILACTSLALDPLKARRPMVICGLVLWSLLSLGLNWTECRTWRDGMTLWQKTAKRAPSSMEVQNNLGNAFLDAGDFASAEKAFRAAIEASSHPTGPLVGLSKALWFQGQSEEAKRALVEAIHLDPNLAIAYLNLGNMLSLEGNLDEAENLYLRAIQIDPQDPEPCFNLGNLMAERARFEEALAWYRQALSLKPDHILARKTLERVSAFVSQP